MNDRDERYLTACHEAGHAVAAMLRGGATFVSITLERTAAYGGHNDVRCRPFDAGFITYAGPWAQARAQWHGPTLDDDDEDGCCFGDYVVGALIENAEDTAAWRQWDAELLQAAQDDFTRRAQQESPELLGGLDPGAAREQGWERELERCWPVIQQVAAMLVNGVTVTPVMVTGLLER